MRKKQASVAEWMDLAEKFHLVRKTMDEMLYHPAVRAGGCGRQDKVFGIRHERRFHLLRSYLSSCACADHPGNGVVRDLFYPLPKKDG